MQLPQWFGAGLLRSTFLRSVATLVSGTMVSQFITFLGLLLTTRLYSPADFTVLASFTSIVGSVGALACLRLELAVPLAESEADGVALLLLSLMTCTALSVLAACVAIAAPAWITEEVLHQPALGSVIWLMPIGIFAVGALNAFQMWGIRTKRFGWMAITRGVQASAAVGTQLSMAALGAGSAGLPLGTVANSVVGTVLLLRNLERHHLAEMARVRAGRLIVLLQRFRRFPGYSTLEVICNSAGNQLPILIVAAVAVGPEAGYIALALTLLQAPIGLLGNAVSQVYTSRLTESVRTGQLDELTLRVFLALTRSGAGPLVFAGIAAPPVFALVFGLQWYRAGEFALWMTPWIILQFLAVPISMVYNGTGNQRLSLIIQFLGAIARLVPVLIAWKVAPRLIGEVFCLSGTLFYGLLLGGALWCASVPARRVFGAVGRSLPLLAAWAAAGLLVKFGLGALSS